MTTPVPNPDETSRMKRIENAGLSDSIKNRLPHGTVGTRPPALPPPPPPAVVASASPSMQEGDVPPFRSRLLTAFWTVASVISLTVNVILIALLFILVDMIAGLQFTANDQVSGLLGGLYGNFVKMDNATISRVIPVDANIPLNFEVPVHLAGIQTQATQIQLAEDAVIKEAHVRITEGGVQIDARRAEVILPAGTRLSVNIQGLNLDFNVPIQQTIPVHLDVPVNIPMRETQLHEAFFGLQQVVEPYYCLVEPNAMINNQMVCGLNR
jgi:hypothetical protein